MSSVSFRHAVWTVHPQSDDRIPESASLFAAAWLQLGAPSNHKSIKVVRFAILVVIVIVVVRES